MRRLVAVLALGLSVASHAGVPVDSIEDFIATENPASGVPGMAYAVVVDDAITSVGAYGVVEIGSDATVTPDTPS